VLPLLVSIIITPGPHGYPVTRRPSIIQMKIVFERLRLLAVFEVQRDLKVKASIERRRVCQRPDHFAIGMCRYCCLGHRRQPRSHCRADLRPVSRPHQTNWSRIKSRAHGQTGHVRSLAENLYGVRPPDRDGIGRPGPGDRAARPSVRAHR
jgi:hypothetical protein